MTIEEYEALLIEDPDIIPHILREELLDSAQAQTDFDDLPF